ncbi:hypothetical protein ACOSQ2_013404 [Xanthoceras sorbifolium]
MFSSELWEQCKWSTSTKGKAAFATIMSMSFWNGVTTCLKVFAPLVNVLRLVDRDRKPAMGFVYGELLQAKEEIKMALNNDILTIHLRKKDVKEIMRNTRFDKNLKPIRFTHKLLYLTFRKVVNLR